MAMFSDSFEQPLPCVLDERDRDKLLERLIAVHGSEPRADATVGKRVGRDAREPLQSRLGQP